jgi:outer membrane protein assembly factor BamB
MYGLLALVVMALALVACGGSTTASAPVAPTQAAPAAQQADPPPLVEAEPIPVITVGYAEGRITVLRGGMEQVVDIGDVLEIQDTLRTHTDGSCDIQFGRLATVRVRPNTSLSISNFFETRDASTVNVKLDTGTILCKVQRLAGTDRFEVRTHTTVAGVRGTEFTVTAESPERTRVAVNQGRVAVIPAALDPALVQLAGAAVQQVPGTVQVQTRAAAMADLVQTELAAVLDDYFMTEATIISANTELVITSADSAEFVPVVALLMQEVEQAVAEASPEIIAEMLAAIASDVSPAPVVADSSTRTATDTAVGTTDAPAAVDAPAPDRLVRAPVRPASIVLQNQAISAGIKTSLRTQSQTVTKRVEPASKLSVQDFTEFTTISLPAPSPQSVPVDAAPPAPEPEQPAPQPEPVSMVPKAPPVPASAVQAPAVQAPAVQAPVTPAATTPTAPVVETAVAAVTPPPPVIKTARVWVSAEPASAEIVFDGRVVGRGTANSELVVGTQLNLEVRASGYKPETLTVPIDSESARQIPVKLQRLQSSITVQATPATAEILFDGRTVGRGTVSRSFDTGSVVKLEVRAEHHLPLSMELGIDETPNRSIPVRLERARQTYSFRATPATADIYLDGSRIGTGTATATLDAGTNHEVVFRNPGYQESRTSFTARIGDSTVVGVTLQRTMKTLTINASTSEAQITINGKETGQGSLATTAGIGDRLNITVAAKGYHDESRSVTVDEVTPPVITIALRPSLIADRLKTGTASIIGVAVDAADRLYLADATGTLSAYNSQGQRIWSKSTQNGPNELSIPVLAGDAVCFSGAREMLLLDAAAGTLRSQSELGKDSSHLFGNRVLAVRDTLYIPTANTISVADRNGRTLRTIPVPDGTLATPALWGEVLVVLTQTGGVNLYNSGTGALIRTIRTRASQPVGAAPLILGDRAYFPDRRGMVFAVDLKGEVIWSQSAGTEGAFTDLVTDGKGIYGLFGKNLAALSLGDGKPLFAAIPGVATPPALIDGQLVFGTAKGTLEIVNPATGRLTKSIVLGAVPAARPVARGSLIAVGCADGLVVLVNPAGQ